VSVAPLHTYFRRPSRPTIWSSRLLELYDYWDHKRHGRAAPGRADLDPADIPRLLPIVYLVDVTHSPLDFRFRLVGTEFCEKYGRDFTGERLVAVNKHDHRDEVLADYERCAALRVPVVSRRDFVNDMGVNWRYERILLPLCDDDGPVNMLIGGMDIRIPLAEWRKLERLHGEDDGAPAPTPGVAGGDHQSGAPAPK